MDSSDTRTGQDTVAKTVVELCATLVTAQVQRQRMTSQDIYESIRIVYATLAALNRANYQPAESTGQGTEAHDNLDALRRHPKESIQKDRVICLECGRGFRLLSNRHVALHELMPRDYKRKWGIPQTTALSARSLTAHRRKTAKKMGMGKALADWRATRRQLTG